MFRKTVIAIAATAVIGVASLTPASAHGFSKPGSQTHTAIPAIPSVGEA